MFSWVTYYIELFSQVLIFLQYSWVSLVAQLVKNTPAMQETWVGKIPWRRERLPTPVFWPGEFHGLYSLWGHKESDTTEQLSLSLALTFLTLPPLWLLRNPSSESNSYHQLFKSTASCMYMLLLLSWGLRINHWLLPFRWWLSYQNKPNQIYKNTKCIRDGKRNG